jgi:hypothetical protein
MRSVFAAALLMLVIAGCGKSGPAAPTGTYQTKLAPNQTLSLTFLGDDAMEVKMNEGGKLESYKKNFVTSGETIVMNIPEAERQSGGPNSMTLKRNGEALEWAIEGMTLRFEKQ